MTAPLRPAAPAGRGRFALAGFSLLAAAGLLVFPFATLTRSFDGSAALLVQPGRVVDFTGFLPKALPSFATVTALNWLAVAALLALSVLAVTGSRWLGWAGLAVALLGAGAFAAFVRAVDAAQLPLLAQGVAYRRLPFQGVGPNLGAYLPVAAGLAGVLVGLARDPARAGRLGGWRGGIVPLAALGLSVAVGGAIILILQPVPGLANGPASFARVWLGKVDLLWYSYSTLFGPALPRLRPVLDLTGPWQSLQLATPLIFTGLSLAFAFRAGLFNIGAAGQLLFGAMFATAVGVYLPGPWFVLGPLCVLAAALGGAFWGAIPGWLKARFGASEVIITIMLNSVAADVFLFLIGSNQASFFGHTVRLPFRAPGPEAKTAELHLGARLQNLTELLGLHAGVNPISLAPWLGLIGLAAGWSLGRGAWRRRLTPALGLAVLGLVAGLLIGPVGLSVPPGMASTRLNTAFLLALVAAVFYAVFMWRTRYGFELRAVGLAPKAAEYAGANIGRNIVLAMAISGALAGLASTHYVLGGALEEYRLKQAIPSETAGFGGITVALLGQNTPLGVIGAAALFGVLGTGGLNLTQALDKVSREIVTVLQALIVLFIAVRAFISSRRAKPVVPGEPAASYPKASPGAGSLAGQDLLDPDAVEESRA